MVITRKQFEKLLGKPMPVWDDYENETNYYYDKMIWLNLYAEHVESLLERSDNSDSSVVRKGVSDE